MGRRCSVRLLASDFAHNCLQQRSITVDAAPSDCGGENVASRGIRADGGGRSTPQMLCLSSPVHPIPPPLLLLSGKGVTAALLLVLPMLLLPSALSTVQLCRNTRSSAAHRPWKAATSLESPHSASAGRSDNRKQRLLSPPPPPPPSAHELPACRDVRRCGSASCCCCCCLSPLAGALGAAIDDNDDTDGPSPAGGGGGAVWARSSRRAYLYTGCCCCLPSCDVDVLGASVRASSCSGSRCSACGGERTEGDTLQSHISCAGMDQGTTRKKGRKINVVGMQHQVGIRETLVRGNPEGLQLAGLPEHSLHKYAAMYAAMCVMPHDDCIAAGLPARPQTQGLSVWVRLPQNIRGHPVAPPAALWDACCTPAACMMMERKNGKTTA
jgi:hypothetical protein